MAEYNTLGVIVDGKILVIDHSIPSDHILNILVRGIF